MSARVERQAASAGARAGATRTIKVEALARVEGEGGLLVKVRGGRVQEARLDIFEPPRLFEALLRGRRFTEAPDITARICGICPVAYQMSACQAMESACGVKVEGPLAALRRLLYCGEWIESHVLHVAMLHAPDFLGYESAFHMAADHPQVVEQALRLKKLGNGILELLGGRSVHPVNVRVGGFYRVPPRREILALVPDLERGREEALALLAWVAGFDFPAFERAYELVALRHGGEYPMNEGRIVSSGGLNIAVEEYLDHFEEHQVAHSHALHAREKGRGPYLVGPLARFALNFDRLSPLAREAARAAGVGPDCRNPFRSIVVRAVETVYAFDEALRLVAAYEEPRRPFVEVEPRAATGCGATEAPRGILFHRYVLDPQGLIADARIIPPTSQNQATVEEDLRRFVEARLELPDDRLTWQCEQVIRNYDPCISCATHALRVKLDRE
jgi:coenzyme F420-reducing hydrogenase alpha subunit